MAIAAKTRSAAGSARTIGLLLAAVAALAAAGPHAAGAALLQPGAAFPAWILRGENGKAVRSDDLAGKTYLLWYYPKAMTPGCTAEGNALRDSFQQFSDAGVEILGVSFDPPSVNEKFVKEQEFPFRLLTDDGSLAIKVGAADARDQATPRRISYLVGPDGKVLRAYGSVNPATHAQEVLGDVAASPASTTPATEP